MVFNLHYRGFMSNTEKQAGDHIDARCTRCRAITNHTIIAMVDDRPVRVRCNTCGGDHNYRQPRQVRAAKFTVTAAGAKPGRRTAADRKRVALEEEWQAAAGEADPGLAAAYDMQRGYRINDLVDHPTFGVGVVKAIMKPNKMEVLFATGSKIMRCKA